MNRALAIGAAAATVALTGCLPGPTTITVTPEFDWGQVHGIGGDVHVDMRTRFTTQIGDDPATVDAFCATKGAAGRYVDDAGFYVCADIAKIPAPIAP